MNSMKITVICGLPGSGKTFLARKLLKESGGSVLDDKFTAKDFKWVWPLVNHLYITDPMLCQKSVRSSLIHLIADTVEKGQWPDIEWIWFDNDVEKAIENINRRRDGRIITEDAMRNYFSKIYEIPEGIKTIPVWWPNGDNV